MRHQKYLKAFLAQAQVALDSHHELSQRSGFTRLPSGATQFDVTNKYVLLPVDILRGTESDGTISLVKNVSTTITCMYYANKCYAEASTGYLMNFIAASENTIVKGASAASKIGLWGKVPGDGHHPSRYYPLLAEDGYNAYLKVVEDAKNGIHPLYGAVKDSENNNGEEPVSDVAEAPTPAPEAVVVLPEVSQNVILTDVPDSSEEIIPEHVSSGINFGGLPSGYQIQKVYHESL